MGTSTPTNTNGTTSTEPPKPRKEGRFTPGSTDPAHTRSINVKLTVAEIDRLDSLATSFGSVVTDTSDDGTERTRATSRSDFVAALLATGLDAWDTHATLAIAALVPNLKRMPHPTEIADNITATLTKGSK